MPFFVCLLACFDFCFFVLLLGCLETGVFAVPL